MTPDGRADDWPSPDAEALLGDEPELMSTAADVHQALHSPEIDPEFRQRLRSELLAERRNERAQPPRTIGGLRSPRARLALVAAAVVAAAGIGGGLVAARPWDTSSGPPAVAVGVTTTVAGQVSVDPAAPIVVHFDQPMDHAAVSAALRVSPATAVTQEWRGSDLVLTATHGFVPNQPYVVSVLGHEAKTATGAPLRSDQRVVFGTASSAVAAAGAPPPAALAVRTAVSADNGSEAVILTDGSLVATAATVAGAGSPTSALVRIASSGTSQIGPATAAICVSRTGRSLAYLSGAAGATSIVIAAGDGSQGRALAAKVDDGSPLGWINDDRVSFVSGGRLTAIDRSGRTQVLTGDQVDAAHDTVDIASGGRYVFLRAAGQQRPGDGVLVDLVAGSRRALPGIVGDPAFDGAGSTVVWVDGSGPARRLSVEAAGGGPVLHLSLPVAAGDEVGALAVSPDGSRVAYTVTHSYHSAEMRVASLADGATLAVSSVAGGDSPNWSPAGDRIAVLSHPNGRPEIQVVDVPPSLGTARGQAAAAAAAFANAQISGDQEAERALGTPTLALPHLPAPTRATVIQATPTSDTSVEVDLRLVTDPTPQHPVARVTDERVSVQIAAGGRRATVDAVVASSPHDLTPGPHAVGVEAGTGVVTVRFDSDLDARSIAAALSVRGSDGSAIVASASYDAGSRAVTVRLPAGTTGQVTLNFGRGLRDIAGEALAAADHITVVASAG